MWGGLLGVCVVWCTCMYYTYQVWRLVIPGTSTPACNNLTLLLRSNPFGRDWCKHTAAAVYMCVVGELGGWEIVFLGKALCNKHAIMVSDGCV